MTYKMAENDQKYFFSPNSSCHFHHFGYNSCYKFSLFMKIMFLNILTKIMRQQSKGVREMLTELTKGGGGFGEVLTMADEGGMVG